MPFKKFIPTAFKKPFWWLFKAPQHQAGLFTYGLEIKGYIGIISDIIFSSSRKRRAPITICVSNKNRSEAVINFLVKSIMEADNSHLISLSVFDCGSDDALLLEKTLKDKFGERVQFESMEMNFSRSIALNRAVRNARNSLLLICDADISVPRNILEKVNFYIHSNRAWFPVCKAFATKEENSFSWYMEGKGIVGCTIEQFEKCQGFDASITDWGGEDSDLWYRFWKNKIFCYRSKEANLIHHWHPSVERAKKQW